MKTSKKSNSNNKESSLFKAGLLFMFFSAIVSVMNYLYHLFMGRMLGPHDYGVLGSLFAIIYIVTFATSTFNLVISKQVAEFKGKNQLGKIKKLINLSMKRTAIAGIFGMVLFILATPFIADFMNIESYSGIILVGVIAYASFLSVLLSGALNGMQKFVSQNISSFTSVFLKLGVAIFLVWLGYSVNGALGAIVLGTAAGMFIAYLPLRSQLKNSKEESIDLKKSYRFAVPVFFASMFAIFLITLDQILVKHYFSSEQAGIYAAAGNIAKIIWFGSSFLIAPLFPKIVESKAKGKNTSNLLTKSLIYISVIIFAGCAMYFIAPTFIVNLLYGSQYLAAVPLIGMFGLALGIFSLLQILMTYNLAIEKYGFIYIFLAGIIAEVAGIYMFHSNLGEIVKIILITNLAVLVSCIIYNKNDILGDLNNLKLFSFAR